MEYLCVKTISFRYDTLEEIWPTRLVVFYESQICHHHFWLGREFYFTLDLLVL